MTPIRIMALRHSAFYSPLLCAIANGFLHEQGLDAQYRVASANDTVEDAISNGTADVAQSAVAVSLVALERGEPPPYTHFAQINDRDGFFLVAREVHREFSWRDLLGKSVLVDHFFQPLAMFKYACALQGVTYKALQAQDVGDVAAIERAFRQGIGDYAQLQGPSAQQLEHDGIGRIVASIGHVIGPVAFSSLCAAPGWLTTSTARAFLHAYGTARSYALQTESELIADTLINFFPETSHSVLAKTISAYQDLGCWSGDIGINPSSYEKVLEIFTDSGDIRRVYSYEQVITKMTAN
jgi:NitT/TauT family transport system substrate-binding protein